jgi:hypothetical protein
MVVDERVGGPPAPASTPVGGEGTSPEPVGGRGVRGWRTLVLGAGAYLVLAVGLWWNVWSTHPTSTTTCGCGDTSLFTWFLEWPAYALAHGLDPLYSTHLFHPTGINLLSNTAVVGIGIVLAPVTWAFGPVATVNVAVTLSPFLSALAMYVLLRRWVAWSPAAWVGGLLYGFSPFVIVSLTDAHLMLGMAPVPPLLVLCLDELLVRQRWRPWVTGLAIGALLLAQALVGTEILVLMLLAAAFGTVLVVAWGLLHPAVVAARAPYALRAGGAAVVSTAVLLAFPVWFALAGPAHLSGGVWGPGVHLGLGGNSLRLFVHPMVPSARATELTHLYGGYQAPTLSGQYLGWGLVGVLAVGLVVWHRDLKLWLFAAVGTGAVFLSLGLSGHGWTAWRLVYRAPLMENVIPSRFALVVYLCAGVLLGLVCDHTYRTVGAVGTGRTAAGDVWARVAGGAAAVLVAAIALVPLISYFADGLPLTTTPVRVPQWFATVAPRLPADQVLLVFPFAFRQSNMTWQAVDHMGYAMIGGGGPDSIPARAGRERAGEQYLADISLSEASQAILPGAVATVRGALDGWGVTGVVLPDPRRLPVYEQVHLTRSIVVLMTAAIGAAPRYVAGAWVWTGVDRAGPPAEPGAARLVDCATGPQDGTVASVQASAACVLAPTAQ